MVGKAAEDAAAAGRSTESVESELLDWARSSLGDLKADLAIGPPLASASALSVRFWLLGALPTPTPRTAQKPPLKLSLLYLLSAQAPQPTDAHRALIELAFSAMEETDWDLDPDPAPPELWTALGVPLQPAVRLRVPLLRLRPERAVRRVRVPLVLKTGPVRSIWGTVLGPGEIPVMGATVELESLGRRASTDHRGFFELPGIPTVPAPGSLRVRARGIVADVPLDRARAAGDEPIEIHLNQLED